MKLYYRAVTQDGTTIKGLIDAKNISDAAHYLRKHQLIPIKIIPSSKIGFQQYTTFFRRVSSSDIVFFTRQLASMLSSGLTLMQGLSILKSQVQNKAMTDIIQEIVVDLENGKTFSTALEKYPQQFSPIYIALARTGETSGLLDKIFLRLAETLEKQLELQRTIKDALLYPIMVVIMMIIVVFIMMIFVIPQLKTLYNNFEMALPLPTVIIINVSTFTATSWVYLTILLIISAFLFRKWQNKEENKRMLDAIMLKVPLFGKLIMEKSMADFSRTLGLLIGSGSLVVDSLLKTADVVNNSLYKQEIVVVAKRVEKGISIGDALEAGSMFPPMIVEMVKIGEQTGKLNESLLRASEYYEREVEDSVKTMTTLLQPLILLILALGVGFLIFAVIAPIYQLISSLQ